jgi:hypothetical protein
LPLTFAAALFAFLALTVLTDSVPVIVRPPVRPFVAPPTQKVEVPLPPELAPVVPRAPSVDWPLPAK